MSERLAERPLPGGVLWLAAGPRGAVWCIAWQPGTHGEAVRAWPLETGAVSPLYRGSAGSVDEARTVAARIVGEIRGGVRAAAEARDAAIVAAGTERQ